MFANTLNNTDLFALPAQFVEAVQIQNATDELRRVLAHEGRDLALPLALFDASWMDSRNQYQLNVGLRCRVR